MCNEPNPRDQRGAASKRPVGARAGHPEKLSFSDFLCVIRQFVPIVGVL